MIIVLRICFINEETPCLKSEIISTFLAYEDNPIAISRGAITHAKLYATRKGTLFNQLSGILQARAHSSATSREVGNRRSPRTGGNFMRDGYL